ncbi:hypothetical protein GGR50DRAFT_691504 [Xylaria sp. CBS 124048]|nr:hypothetical protein GGR50DRAFT_691504 [Xylaria sp. CBS 124048]
MLETGARTGGTTSAVAPFLVTLDILVEYTTTDISASVVANARRMLGKKYPFMKFAMHDIEKMPAEEHRGQHIILASNAVHATHSLVVSARNIRQAPRPNGFLMIFEMIEVVPFVDLVFGFPEGWRLFDDGRKHAVVSVEHWELIMALAPGNPEPEHLPKCLPSAAGPTGTTHLNGDNVEARELEAEAFVTTRTRDWDTPELNAARNKITSIIFSSAAVCHHHWCYWEPWSPSRSAIRRVAGVATVVCSGYHIVTKCTEKAARLRGTCAHAAVMPGSYTEAKCAYERMLDETLPPVPATVTAHGGAPGTNRGLDQEWLLEPGRALRLPGEERTDTERLAGLQWRIAVAARG